MIEGDRGGKGIAEWALQFLIININNNIIEEEEKELE